MGCHPHANTNFPPPDFGRCGNPPRPTPGIRTAFMANPPGTLLLLSETRTLLFKQHNLSIIFLPHAPLRIMKWAGYIHQVPR